MKTVKFLIPALLLLIFSCTSKEEEIKKVKFWKHSDGAMFADIISFNNKDYSIKNDTIFKLSVPEFKVESHERRVLAGDQVLQIKELKNGKIARYASK